MGWLVSVHLAQKTSGDPLQKTNQSRISKVLVGFLFMSHYGMWRPGETLYARQPYCQIPKPH